MSDFQASSGRKLYRLQNKRKKLVAFLELPNMNEEYDQKTKKMRYQNDYQTLSEVDNNSINALLNVMKKELEVSQPEDLFQLKAMLKEKKRLKEQLPLLYLTNVGLEAQVHVENEKFYPGEKYAVPIFVQDLQHLLLTALLGEFSPYKPRWCTLLRWKKISSITLVIVEDLNIKNFLNKTSMKGTVNLADMVVEVLPPTLYNSTVAEELLCVPISNTAIRLREDRSKKKKILDPILNVENVHKACQDTSIARRQLKDQSLSKYDKFPRTSLLLNPLMMIIEKYPLPTFKETFRDYVFTKDVYKEVTDASPMFALDCEMCLTCKRKLELTRISIVNENLEVVYDTLVKPENKIIDYLTRFSGITEELLRDVKTTLPMVQQKIREILPPDAILCGQALQNDLNAIQMIHPYVIDTSVIYNLSGLRRIKTGLKKLTKMFLDSDIQCSDDGHSSVEDSIATMKLILHKLGHNIEYGDVTIGWSLTAYLDRFENSSLIYDPSCLPVKCKTGFVTSLYSKVKIREKSVALIGLQASLMEYSLQETGFSSLENVDQYEVEDNKEVTQQSCKLASKYDFVLSVMQFKNTKGNANKDQKRLLKLDKRLMKIYKQLPENSLFVVLLNSPMTEDYGEECRSVCLVKIKSVDVDSYLKNQMKTQK